MKKWILAFALTLVFSLVAVAQSDSSSNASGAQSSSGSTATAPSSQSSDTMGASGQTSTEKSSTSSTDKSATSASSGKSEHLTGCLEQGSTPGTYMLKDSKHPNGVQVSYSGSEDLSKHVGHKVKVTGTMSGDTLNASNVKHISETCSVGSASMGKHDHSKASSSSDTSTAPKSDTSNPK